MKRVKGIKVKDIVEGTGAVADKGKTVLVQYDCRLTRGELVFSNRHTLGERIRLGKRETTVGLEQGVVGMKVGGKRKIKVSPNLTRGERNGFPDLPEGAVLWYEVDLLWVGDKSDMSMYRQYNIPKRPLRSDAEKPTG